MDPHSRTLVGFMALIQKDWLMFGHQFTRRLGLCGQGSSEQSFVFTQFLDCIWQLTRLHTRAFEFTEDALLAINAAALTGMFGTFMGNCDRERCAAGWHAATPCMWAWLASHAASFRNPSFDPLLDPTVLLALPADFQPSLWLRAYAPSVASSSLLCESFGLVRS